MHQSDQIILKDCSYLLLEKCLCGGSTCSFKAFSFPTCGVHSHAPVAQFQPSCQNASDASSPKIGGAEAGNLPPEPNQYLDSFRRQSLRWLSHLAASFAPVCFQSYCLCSFKSWHQRDFCLRAMTSAGCLKRNFPLLDLKIVRVKVVSVGNISKEVEAHVCSEFSSSFT